MEVTSFDKVCTFLCLWWRRTFGGELRVDFRTTFGIAPNFGSSLERLDANSPKWKITDLRVHNYCNLVTPQDARAQTLKVYNSHFQGICKKCCLPLLSLGVRGGVFLRRFVSLGDLHVVVVGEWAAEVLDNVAWLLLMRRCDESNHCWRSCMNFANVYNGFYTAKNIIMIKGIVEQTQNNI